MLMFGLYPKKKIRVKLADGQRVIAIGDIHGQRTRLAGLMASIDDYRKRKPAEEEHIVFLGDFVDRGPYSAQIIEYLRERAKKAKTAKHSEIFLHGNHEELLLDGLDHAGKRHDMWWRNGGMQTVESYLKFQKVEAAEGLNVEEKLQLFRGHFPKQHLKFMHALKDMHQVGPLVFVHAGIQMDSPLTEQKHQDVRWIRDPFLHWKGKDNDFLVVHGHSITPSFKPEIHKHRIAIDTGSYRLKGKISAAIFEKNTVRFISDGTKKDFIRNKFS